ncbi:Lar family restriction alleviation protein [Brevundimonas sp. 2R-24]|uniref:Lar family restriction alleviation protein n=1 Tax=Peiella sedimenti TaxID=3061083 RepID=A0ABT8SP76_9CAUL|nr:Lar family restriction alleviation protein [Caulobacteraceae bacterium XZ-24]
MTVELKPCPFCRGEARHAQRNPVARALHHVQCDDCDASQAGSLSPEAAAAAWNSRPEAEPAPAGEVEAIVRRWANWIVDESADYDDVDHAAGKRKVLGERDLILAALTAHPAPAGEVGMRDETISEHIARDMREGRFPQRSERQQVPLYTAPPAIGLTKEEVVQELRDALRLQNPDMTEESSETVWLSGGATPQSAGCIINVADLADAILSRLPASPGGGDAARIEALEDFIAEIASITPTPVTRALTADECLLNALISKAAALNGGSDG